jgi:hypothetical protein
MSVIVLPPYVSPVRLQQRIVRSARLLAWIMVVAAVASMMIEPKRDDCRAFTIGVSAIGGCDGIGR